MEGLSVGPDGMGVEVGALVWALVGLGCSAWGPCEVGLQLAWGRCGSNGYGVEAGVGLRLWCGMVGHDSVGWHRSGPAAQNQEPDSGCAPHCVWLPNDATEWLRRGCGVAAR
jgi:hypothetical protein